MHYNFVHFCVCDHGTIFQQKLDLYKSVFLSVNNQDCAVKI